MKGSNNLYNLAQARQRGHVAVRPGCVAGPGPAGPSAGQDLGPQEGRGQGDQGQGLALLAL